MKAVCAVICALVLQQVASAQLPNGAPAPGNPSATGVGEINRIAKAYDDPPEDVKRLQALLPDWARLSFYAEENAKLSGKKIDVVFLGDSITHNWANPKFTTLLQDHEYVGRGIGGQITAQMLLRMPQDVFALHPKVVVLLGGTNDLAMIKVPDVLATIENNLAMMAELGRAHGIRMILTSVMPVNDDHRPLTKNHPPEQILALNMWIKKYAADHDLTYMDYYSALSDGKDRMRSSLSADGLHPNADGYKVLDPLIEKAIETNLRK